MKKIAIIGGGPAALMLTAQLDTGKFNVTIYEKKKRVGRKFLVAGEGGLNLTYNSSLEELSSQYFPGEFMRPIIHQFTHQDFMTWLSEIGVPTFIGSSKRVFPARELKPIEVLNKLVEFISSKGVKIQGDTKWMGWNEAGHPSFENTADVEADIVVFALGGASWKVTGSDGKWSSIFSARGINVNPFRAANCAFAVKWNEKFIAAHAGKPLKNIALTYQGHSTKGELVITDFGLEGNAIYALSQKLQTALLTEESVLVYLDLKPTMTLAQIKAKYQNSKQSKTTDILKKDLNLDRAAIGLLKSFSDKETFLNPDQLATRIKSIPVPIRAADELDKAISSLGGIALDEVDEHFQLKKIPHSFAIGEMLDWYAPTGGYLLQGCFSMGFVLAQHLNTHH